MRSSEAGQHNEFVSDREFAKAGTDLGAAARTAANAPTDRPRY